MPTVAVITLAFDPIVRLGALVVRLETLALAGVVLSMLLVAAWVARSVLADPALDGRVASGERPRREEHLRRDDLLFVVLGSIPGAVIGGRLGAVLLHLDYYSADPAAILDPSSGSLQLSMAIVGGLLSGSVIGGLLDTPVGRWLHTATFPLLLGLTLGKGAGILGGSGQGLPSDLPWALAYAGAGPWGSLGPDIPSHPSQAYEALAGLVVLMIIIIAHGTGAFRARDGRAFFLALALWATGRFVVAFTWRDASVLGPLRADQLLSLAVVGVALIGFLVAPAALRRYTPQEAVRDEHGAKPVWPDPASRPRF